MSFNFPIEVDMSLSITNNLTPTSLSASIDENYQADAKAIDKAVDKFDKPIKKKNIKKTASTYTHNLNDEEEDDDRAHHGDNPFYVKVFGIESLLSIPNDDDVSGMEDFIDKIKIGAKELIRIIGSFFIWLWELVFNRVERLKSRVFNLIEQLKTKGIKMNKHVKYPPTSLLLMTNYENRSMDWIKSAIKEIEDFYIRVMAGQEIIKAGASKLPSDFTEEKANELIAYLYKVFTKAVIGSGNGAVVTEDESSSKKLPGNRVLKIVNNKKDKVLHTLNVNLVNAPTAYKQPLTEYVPDYNIISKVLMSCDGLIKEIAVRHKSQSNLRREFEKNVNELISEGKFDSRNNYRAAYRYYTWLIAFQRKTITKPMQYVFSSLNAALDYCESGIQRG